MKKIIHHSCRIVFCLCIGAIFFFPVLAQRHILTFADEFNGAANSPPDLTKWGYDIGVGDNGWGNQELEYYTNRTQNAFLDGAGNLIIQAIKENFTDVNGISRQYTSARLITKGKFDQAYGRFEARIKIPFGQGIWPAFWLLGNDIDKVGWPACGEIDILENIGREPFTIHGTLHGPGYSGGNGLSASYSLSNGRKFADDFHVYAIEWDIREIRFYLDEILYKTQNNTNFPAGVKWVFEHPHYIILNVAVGGSWPGYPDATTIFPQQMLVDYVRVFSHRARSTNRLLR